MLKRPAARHGSAPVSQIYAHRNGSTYPEHYQAHCSSIDTVGDVLDEREETYHITYFQGYRQFQEVGLPRELPAEIEEAVLGHPELVEITDHIHRLVMQADFAGADLQRREYRKALARIRMAELHRYQAQWLADRRDLRIINRGKKNPEFLESNACTHALGLIMPELPCIAATMSSTEPLSFDERLLFAKRLLTQCHRDYDVMYLPNESPVDGKCPVTTCRENTEK